MRCGFEELLGIRQGCVQANRDDPRLQPVSGDEIDELVNFQLDQGTRGA